MYVPTTGPLICPHCSGDKIVGFGAKRGQIFVDLPHHGEPTLVSIDRHRYRCKVCDRTFLERLEGIDSRRNISLRLLSFIEKQSIQKPFIAVAKEVGLTEGTIRNIFSDYLQKLESSFHPAVPEILSFDSMVIVSRPSYLVSNFDRGKFIGLFQGQSKESVKTFINQMQATEHIKFVIIDTNDACKNTVQELLPAAQVVINPEYVINMLLKELEHIRMNTRRRLKATEYKLLMHDKEIINKPYETLTDDDKEQLNIWETRFKKLYWGYWRKEELRIILQGSDRQEAMQQCRCWQQDVLADSLKEYFPILDQIIEWQKEIFAWFDIRATHKWEHYPTIKELENALVTCMERGYSFDAVKARILSEKGLWRETGITIKKIIERLRGSNQEPQSQ